jgi:hypothetical protein
MKQAPRIAHEPPPATLADCLAFLAVLALIVTLFGLAIVTQGS